MLRMVVCDTCKETGICICAGVVTCTCREMMKYTCSEMVCTCREMMMCRCKKDKELCAQQTPFLHCMGTKVCLFLRNAQVATHQTGS